MRGGGLTPGGCNKEFSGEREGDVGGAEGEAPGKGFRKNTNGERLDVKEWARVGWEGAARVTGLRLHVTPWGDEGG